MTGSQSSGHDAVDPLERANARLDEACARVAARLDELAGLSDAAKGDGSAAALAAARERELKLAEAADAASRTLDEAMAELRALGAGEDAP